MHLLKRLGAHLFRGVLQHANLLPRLLQLLLLLHTQLLHRSGGCFQLSDALLALSGSLSGLLLLLLQRRRLLLQNGDTSHYGLPLCLAGTGKMLGDECCVAACLLLLIQNLRTVYLNATPQATCVHCTFLSFTP
jgi:hypothetical protein